MKIERSDHHRDPNTKTLEPAYTEIELEEYEQHLQECPEPDQQWTLKEFVELIHEQKAKRRRQ